jgi:hypothetical protein
MKSLQSRYLSVALLALGVLFIMALGYVYSVPERNDVNQTAGEEVVDQTAGEKVVDQTTGEEVVDNTEDMIDEEAEGYDMNVGLFGSLPEGTSIYVGTIEGGVYDGEHFEMTIVKEEVNVNGSFMTAKSDAPMRLDGESTPAMNGDIGFYGTSGDISWNFMLTGTADNITGTGNRDGSEFGFSMRKK